MREAISAPATVGLHSNSVVHTAPAESVPEHVVPMSVMPAPVTLAPVITSSPWVLLRAVTVADEVPPACTSGKAVPVGKAMRGLTMNALYMSPDVT